MPKIEKNSEFCEKKSLLFKIIHFTPRYVQDAAKAAGFKKPASTAILLCGMKGMAEAIKELAAEAGVPEGNVLTNF